MQRREERKGLRKMHATSGATDRRIHTSRRDLPAGMCVCVCVVSISRKQILPLNIACRASHAFANPPRRAIQPGLRRERTRLPRCERRITRERRELYFINSLRRVASHQYFYAAVGRGRETPKKKREKEKRTNASVLLRRRRRRADARRRNNYLVFFSLPPITQNQALFLSPLPSIFLISIKDGIDYAKRRVRPLTPTSN